MIIDCISDLHGQFPVLDGGDLLIVGGDLTATDHPHQYLIFNGWLTAQKYNKKIVIAGNHDGKIQHGIDVSISPKKKICANPILATGAIYLEDSGCELNGLKIWGSPWTPTFYNWHFMKNRGKEIKKMWVLIPDDIDILVTHGPPFGVLDQVKISSKANIGSHAGCQDLLDTLERIQPRLHVFGHVHENYGIEEKIWGDDGGKKTIFVNCSLMNENYDFVNKPIRVIL